MDDNPIILYLPDTLENCPKFWKDFIHSSHESGRVKYNYGIKGVNPYINEILEEYNAIMTKLSEETIYKSYEVKFLSKSDFTHFILTWS